MAHIATLDPNAIDQPVASNGLEVAWQLAIRWAMREEDLDRALAPQGIYPQRQHGQHLVRLMVPDGKLTLGQLRRVALLAEELPEVRLHFTTRQNVELDYVKTDELVGVLDAMAAVGLSARESGGNTVRAVTTCPLAGVCRAEVFDVRPHARRLADRFRGVGQRSMLPRKFKIALSGCDADCAQSRVHDIGLVATRGAEDDRDAAFQVYGGGGLGAKPKLAVPLAKALPASALEELADAVLHTFQRHGDFEHRSRARLKFVVERVGADKFRELIAAECEEHAEDIRRELAADQAWAERAARTDTPWREWQVGASVWSSGAMRPWVEANVVPTRQADHFAVFVPTPQGHVTTGQLRALIDLCVALGMGGVRLTVEQQLLLAEVAGRELENVYQVLERAGLADLGSFAGITRCPGSTLCRHALTSTRGLARELERSLPDGWQADPEFAGAWIKISGCQSSCARPQTATIGLTGLGGQGSGGRYPAYRLFLGGGNVAGKTALGSLVGRLPAQNVPQAVQRLVSLYRERQDRGDTFVAYLRHLDQETARAALADLTAAPDNTADWQ